MVENFAFNSPAGPVLLRIAKFLDSVELGFGPGFEGSLDGFLIEVQHIQAGPVHDNNAPLDATSYDCRFRHHHHQSLDLCDLLGER